MRERMAVPVFAALAETELDARARWGKPLERHLGLGDERPRIFSPPAKRRRGRLHPGEPHFAAAGKLQCFAIDDGGDRACLAGRRQIARNHGLRENKRQAENA